MDAWESKKEIKVFSKEGERVIYAELVKVIDDSNAVYRADEAFPYCAFFRKEVDGKLFETPEAAFETLEEAERWIRRICEECGEKKLIGIHLDQEQLWGDVEADYPPGAEGWLEMDFDVCGGCGHVQGGRVHLS